MSLSNVIQPASAASPGMPFEPVNPVGFTDLSHHDIQSRLQDHGLPFIMNEGQVPEDVRYYTDTFAGRVFITEDGLTYSLRNADGSSRIAIKESFVNGYPMQPYGYDQSQTKVNFFIGSQNNWKTNVPSYFKVSFGQVWDGINVDLKAANNNVEKIFTVAPGADVKDIVISLDGVAGLSINGGKLVLATGLGDVILTQPVAFQNMNGQMKSVLVSYVVGYGNQYGFALGDDYDPDYAVVIDPLLASTYLGGTENEGVSPNTLNPNEGSEIAFTSAGEVYIASLTISDDYPTTTTFLPDPSLNSDVVVSKLSSNLTTLLASTYIAGDSFDEAMDIALDASGNVYVTGRTNSTNYPATIGAFDETINFGGGPPIRFDAFVSKLDSNLVHVASTYLGGTEQDEAFDIVINATGIVYVAGRTFSTDFPTSPGAYDSTFNSPGQSQAFVTALSDDLSGLAGSTFIGGSNDSGIFAIAVNATGHAFVAGWTLATNFPIVGGYQATKSATNQHDTFVAIFSPSLTSLERSTYHGAGSASGHHTTPFGIVLSESESKIYIAGRTQSPGFPTTTGAYDTSPPADGSRDAYISVLPNSLDSLLASTVIGADITDQEARGLAVTATNVYIVALAAADFPVTSGAYSEASNDSYITALDLGLTTIVASTSLGGSNTDVLETIGINPSGDVVVAGHTRSTDFPTTGGAYDTSKAGAAGSFDFTISKLTPDLAAAFVDITFVSNNSPKWGIEEVVVSGLTNPLPPGYTVTLDWGDGTLDQNILISAGQWGPVSHFYDATAIGSNSVVATLVDSNSAVLATSGAVNMFVTGHDTEFLMNDIGSPAADTPLTVSGFLLDKDTGKQLPSGQAIEFVGSGASGLPIVPTSGVVITDSLGVTIDACNACIPDTEGSSENMVLRFHPEGSLTFGTGVQSVKLSIQDTGSEVITFEVTEVGNPTPFNVQSFGSAPDQVDLLISAPGGIEIVKLVSVTGSGNTVGISSIVTFHPENTPEEMINADFENLQPGTYGGSFEIDSGAFFARTRTIDSPGLVLDVTAVYNPPAGGPYLPSSSEQQIYVVKERTWGAAGEPTSFTVDSGTGINNIKCATDADGDGLCSNWEGPAGQISYSGTLYSLCDFECSVGDNHIDMYAEMDYYIGHQPLQGAIDDVVAAFAAVPDADLPAGGNPDNTPGIALHVLVDDGLAHAHDLIQVWADPNSSPDNIQDDFGDIKANNFGTDSERAGGLVAVNNALKAKAQAYHYGIWVHGIGGSCGASTPSGIAEAPGNDFVVSLGCGFTEIDGSHAGSEGDRNEQAGTLMHELGHNLNLDHGGPKEFRQLPAGNSLSGAPAYTVTDAGGNDNGRAFTITGLDVITNQARDGTVIIPVNVPFSATPGTVTVSSISWSGLGANLIINTVSSFVSGTGNSRIVTLEVDFKTTAASTATTGDMGTFTVGLNIGNTGPTLNSPTTPASGARMKIDVSTTDSGMNCKVNYRSVMAYTRQFNTYLGANYVLDFSRSALDLVDEALSNPEADFFSGPAGVKLVNAYNSGGARAYKVGTTPDIDWNGDGNILGSSIQDSNHFGITGCGASANQKQRGYDDWVNIQLDFKEGMGSFDGNYPDPRALLEITPEIVDQQQIQVEEGTATTTATPAGGSYSALQQVTLQSDEPATIYYTADGSDPTESSTSGSSPIMLSIFSDTTLKFFSISDATGNPEGIRTEVYEFPDDTTSPEITVIGDIEEGEHFASGTVPPEPTCTATDTGSGVNEDGCVVTGYSTADGAHTLVATAEDNVGNVATVEIHYSVGPLTLLGFYSPTDNPPTINTVKTGKVVPLKFEVFAGATELTDVVIVDTVKQFKVSCDPDAPTDPVEETITSPGGTLLRYDESVGQFVYNWKAPNTKGCYDVVLTLDDGSTLTAKFKTT